jgi:predicted glycosyltransferase involved in capsule biosynthesis
MPIRFSYLLTWRGGNEPSRLSNLHTVLTWLARALPEAEVIVVEQDDAPRLAGPLPHPAVKVIYAFNPGPFNKSWGYNLAQRHAGTNLLAFADADLLLPARQLQQAVEICASTYAAVNPYRRLIDLTPEESQYVGQGNFDWQPERPLAAQNREAIGERVVFCGGLFLIRRDAFIHLGAWDERFRGWGGEDDAMTYKLERARLPATELDDAPALHLWHPRPREATFEQAHYAANTALLAEYRGYSDQQLTRLAEVMVQTHGHREKYRPFSA